jgi:dTDP-4-dehydrorhamnose reductase
MTRPSMSTARNTILVMGASGMLGHAVLRLFAEDSGFVVWGAARSGAALGLLPGSLRERIVTGVDADNFDSIVDLFARTRPDVVVNCIGLVKQLSSADEPLRAIPINALLPHRLAKLCAACGARLVHISTDCVFSGSKGRYRESDPPDAQDLYGRSKHMGEVGGAGAITLRTSIIGHELGTAHGLVGWFLSQTGSVKGYTEAIFSGLPTVELAQVIKDHVLPRPQMHGLYHVSADPISKFDLLKLVAEAYEVATAIVPDNKVVIDRSLDSERFRIETGYAAPAWGELVRRMHAFG